MVQFITFHLDKNVLGIIILQLLRDFTWISLLTGETEYEPPKTKRCRGPAGEPKYEELILWVQELRRVSTVFNKVVTEWFVKEWNAKSWAELFRRFPDYGGYPPLSARDAARDYFSAITNHKLKSFVVFSYDVNPIDGEEFQEGLCIKIFIEGDVCIAAYDSQGSRYTCCWYWKNGVLVDPRPLRGVPVDTPYCGGVLEQSIDKSGNVTDAYLDLCSESYSPLPGLPRLVNPGYLSTVKPETWFRWCHKIHTKDESGQERELPVETYSEVDWWDWVEDT